MEDPTGPTVPLDLRQGGSEGPPWRGESGTEDALSDALAELTREQNAHWAADRQLTDRDRLLAIFAHDLRTLLNVLTLNAELFMARGRENAKENAGKMRRSIGRMDRLLSDLVDLAMLNQGQLRTLPRPHDLTAVLVEAVDFFRPLASARSLSLTLAGTEEPRPANIDPDRIFQVLSNLLANAIKFTPSGGEISVKASSIDGAVRVEVGDTGPGVPRGQLEAIFECYRQAGQIGREGLGLGLFISRAILAAHGGKIWVESRPGEGSTFMFALPAIDPELLDRPKPTLPL